MKNIEQHYEQIELSEMAIERERERDYEQIEGFKVVSRSPAFGSSFDLFWHCVRSASFWRWVMLDHGKRPGSCSSATI